MTDASLGPDMAPVPPEGATSSAWVDGLVVARAHSFFEVAANGTTYLCTLRGKLRKSRPALSPSAPTNARPAPSAPRKLPRGAPANRAAASAITEPPERPLLLAVGDRVRFTPLGNGEGIIEEILPRTAVLARARPEVGGEQVMLANPERAILVFATAEPAPDLWLLDRYLALCAHADVAAVICFNKVDLGMPAEVAATEQRYEALGYPILRTSATSGQGLAELRARLGGGISLLTGPSGVGKSSLMNALLPEAEQRTGEISQATGKGRHTTTGARLLPLPEGGWLADSAGIRELALWNVPADELPNCFIELRPVADQCQYEDCTHAEDEEGCALRAALATGTITPERFHSFARLLAIAQSAEQPEWATSAR